MSTSQRQAEEIKRTAHAALSALNMQPAQCSPHYSEVKCNNTAIMHIWYLKSPCLMVIFVPNWIYYKMCSDMKHVAAGPLRRQCKGGKKGIRWRNKQNIGVIAANSPRLTSSLEASGVGLSLPQRGRSDWVIKRIKWTWCQSFFHSRAGSSFWESELDEKHGFMIDCPLCVILFFQGWLKL